MRLMYARQECLAGPARELAFRISFAQPNQQPKVSQKYGVSYFKQDFTNIRFGDMAEGHESRTRNESLLRGLRGLLEAQDLLRKAAPLFCWSS